MEIPAVAIQHIQAKGSSHKDRLKRTRASPNDTKPDSPKLDLKLWCQNMEGKHNSEDFLPAFPPRVMNGAAVGTLVV